MKGIRNVLTVGLLATVLVSSVVGVALAGKNERLKARVLALETEVDDLNRRQAAVDVRLAAVDARLVAVDDLEAQVDDLEAQVDQLAQRLADVQGRTSRLTGQGRYEGQVHADQVIVSELVCSADDPAVWREGGGLSGAGIMQFILEC